MKKLLLRLVLLSPFLCLATNLYAQNTPRGKNVPPPISTREISGIVKDSTDLGVPGVTIRLTSERDTLITSTNPDGIFVFKNVKLATYTMSFTMMGYKQQINKYKQNDAIPRVVMDPVILQPMANTLDEVVIKGAPSITYKTDTVEYKASDYIVRENATVDELLKKMEGMEVTNDGTLVHQGNNVTKAKINGKTYAGGDIATAIQNLPAEIVDKIQIVDDYGDQAARTGIKDGDPEKILNIVTRTDKSVGNSANIQAGGGSNERYESSLFGTRLNGNQNLSVNLRLNNTVNGVANTGTTGGEAMGNGGGGGGRGNGGNNGGGGRGGNAGGGSGSGNSASGSGGTTNSGGSAFSYRDQIGSKVRINTNYRYNFSNVNSLNSSLSEIYSTNGTIFSTNESERDNKTRNHNFNFEVEADIDSNNFLRITPEVTFSSTNNSGISSIGQSGDLITQNQLGSNLNKNTRPNIGATVFYQHIFSKPRRNLSLQFSFNSANQESEQERNTKFYKDDINVLDSLVHRLIARRNLTSNYRGSFTYVEPLAINSQLEFNGQVNYNGYDNRAITSDIDAFDNRTVVDALSNIYDYSFTQARIALNYRYGLSNTSKVRFSVGLTGVPAVLSGTKVSLGTTTHRNSFNLIPIARFQYQFSKTHSIQVNYSGNAQEPTFDQIQPVSDVSNPQNTIVGNPDLKVTFNHTVNLNYNNYIANHKLNYSVNANGTLIDNSVVSNMVQIFNNNNELLRNETRYVNMNGGYRVGGNYSINKQLNNRKYNLALSGNVNYIHGVSMSNNIESITNTWNITERFGPRINPNEWLEVNPNVSYNIQKSNNTISPNRVNTQTWALNVDGRFYMWQSLIFGYSASKNFVSGINANITSNPLVINAYLQKEFFKRRASVTFQAFDILKQNNFVNLNVTDLMKTETRTNALSRYFMLRVNVRLQKWTGASGRNGRQMMRRGDGSFY
ncbi:outer membrane beta-barrel protein [Pedobacter xixiisoli]|uniref:Outer membrane receptor proteins, mostly Fe transport n=1 Tax=Pedobacter xixiisoli TaxID=1476464 RepID=A0A286A0T9_9SPHI|nr:outer membrane beta-barrel protein [Pedobacter xixiisoli]SOD15514.1 Outer membrane receptor proteins, mostly Fe transport [Pedobacter xixiisoli]